MIKTTDGNARTRRTDRFRTVQVEISRITTAAVSSARRHIHDQLCKSRGVQADLKIEFFYAAIITYNYMLLAIIDVKFALCRFAIQFLNLVSSKLTIYSLLKLVFTIRFL